MSEWASACSRLGLFDSEAEEAGGWVVDWAGWLVAGAWVWGLGLGLDAFGVCAALCLVPPPPLPMNAAATAPMSRPISSAASRTGPHERRCAGRRTGVV